MKSKNLQFILLLLTGVFLNSATMAQNYNLYIAEVQVTEDNAGDLSVIDGVEGTVTYDDNTKTLTLDNATIECEVEYASGIKSYIENLKINLVGENTLNSYDGLYSNKATEITGNGSLVVTADEAGIFLPNEASLTIKNCSVEVISNIFGISGTPELTEVIIDNASVKVTGMEAGSITNIASLTLINCAITAPEGAAFDEELKAVALNGEIVTEQVVIEPITGIQETENMQDIAVYPNPVNDYITVNIDELNSNNQDLQIYDITGKLVLKQNIDNGTMKIDIKHLKSGVYIIKNGGNIRKFIKN